jgi:peroxiredoxin
MKKFFIVFFLIIFSTQVFAMGARPKKASPSLKAIDFTLKDLSGVERTLSDYRGKVVFLNFWATWCPPCRAEMPSMQKLNDKLKNEDFVMLAVGLDKSKRKIKDFINEGKYTFTVLVDSENRVARKYKVTGIPTTYIIDKQGAVVLKEVGARDWSDAKIFMMIKGMTE